MSHRREPVSRKSPRRDFLSGRAAVDALGDLVDAGVGDGADDACGPVDGAVSGGDYLVTFERRAMACRFQVVLRAGQYVNGAAAALEALDRVEALEAQLSVFRDDSELSRLNRLADRGWVEMEPFLFELIARCKRLHDETGGAFDITASPLWKLWGFQRRQGRVPSDDELAEVLARVGSQHVELDAERRAVRFGRPGMEMNLGSIGKGYALDECAAVFASHGVNDYVLHAGNSSVLARGSGPDATAQRPSWTVGVVNPLDRRRRIGQITLADQALATSGTATQFFRHGGRRYGHIIDPESGRPSEGVHAVTVVARTAAEADALATAFYIMGRERALAYCRSHDSVGVLLVCPTGNGTTTELVSHGLGGAFVATEA